MKGFNRITLIGHLGKNPEYKKINDTTDVAKVSMATTDTYRDKSGSFKTQTDWHSLVIWGKLACVAKDHLQKGSYLMVEGKLKCRKYEDTKGITRYVSEIIVDTILMLK
jgi:single-strand DNA-binding protein